MYKYILHDNISDLTDLEISNDLLHILLRIKFSLNYILGVVICVVYSQVYLRRVLMRPVFLRHIKILWRKVIFEEKRGDTNYMDN